MPATRAARTTARTKAKTTGAKSTTARTKARRAAPRAAANDGKTSGPIRNLVIVESPAKARTIGNILGADYTVKASIGHVRDLPKSKLGVDVDKGFAATYLVPKEKKKVVDELRAAARKAERVYLATDPDREGEAISWHLVEAAGLQDTPHQRVVFHEITREAILEAFQHPRDIDMDLVNAQQARRVLDRLVGYKISPLLWRKVRRGLSAGRVQSVALRMVVERERDILSFTPMEYWSIDARLLKDGQLAGDAFTAGLQGPARPVGQWRKKDFAILDGAAATALVDRLSTAAYAVASVAKKQQLRRPAPPFTTSTLQQEASRRLGYSATRTMAVAQQLYEGIPLPGRGEVGLITYMRTDSTNLAGSAIAETRHYIEEKFGKEYVPAAPRVYRKKAKGAQEAHEAIRPTSIQREPDALRSALTRDQHRLYTLIWQRMLACQMADAVFDTTSIDIEARAGADAYLFRATDSALRFPGFRRIYIEASDDALEDDERPSLPELAADEALRLRQLLPEQHFTQPPPRFTEASLVKALEENGIGRPSTYAPIMQTLQQRGYVRRETNRLFPEELGLVVSDVLTANFPDVVNIGFTAEMESELDDIASGDRQMEPVVHSFYLPLASALARAEDAPPVMQLTDQTCPEGHPLAIKWGRFGQFLACTQYPEHRYTAPLPEEAEAAAKAAEGEFCAECGGQMQAKSGRFGRFLACPEGHQTRSILNRVGVQCPLDAGEIVEKRTKTRRTFYGCANYPKCEFTSWSRPLPQPCPRCGALIVAQGRGDNARCTACDWRGKPATPATPPAPAAQREPAKAGAG
ncbi:MAG: type I DNA topoisomerase [Dehalococcoidia bacterium]|nr:type I DNA topoisomerase [Dehalococcoidia bacterium]